MPGRFENFPLRPSIAREILLPLFEEQSLWKKNILDARVDQIHRNEGGVPGQQPLANVVKKALQDLQSEGLITSRFGHWQRAACEITDDVTLDADSPSLVDAAEVPQEVDFVVEREIGAGSET